MNASTSVPDDSVPGERAPNAGEGVSDATEPEEEYELDQATDERDGHGGESVSERLEDDRAED